MVKESDPDQQPKQAQTPPSIAEPDRPSHVDLRVSTRRYRGTKPKTSIETLKSSITSTQEQLSTALQQISRLESFHLRAEKSLPSASARDNQHDSAASPLSRTDICSDDQAEAEAALNHAKAVCSRHMALLKQYNEIKDVAMGMLSMIADKEGRRLAEVMEERGLSEKD